VPTVVTFDLPPEIERTLREQIADLDQAAKEGVLVELYRQSKLTHAQLGEALGMTRYEVDGLLKRHNVDEDSISLDEFRAQLDLIDRARGG
jgi:hypothetical protein